MSEQGKTDKKNLADAVGKLIEEMELCRKTYVILWTVLTAGMFIILTKIAGFW